MVGMRIPRGRRVLVVLVVMLAAASMWIWARPAASVPRAPTAVLKVDASRPDAVLRVETNRPGNAFDLGAVGLSLEAWELSTGRLTADHYRFVRLMRLLGPSVLRIGGNTVDLSWWTSSGEPPPTWATNTVTPADLSVLHGLLAATGWRVLLGVNLGHFEPARAADEARYAKEILGNGLLGIEIGNEPNNFGHSGNDMRSPIYYVNDYVGEVKAYRQALTAATRGVADAWPATSTAGIQWLAQMETTADIFTELTQHYYAINTCPTTTPPFPRATAVELLSPAIRGHENQILNALTQAGATAGRPTRIGETDSVGCRGSVDASPAFAIAVWALDWALRAAVAA